MTISEGYRNRLQELSGIIDEDVRQAKSFLEKNKIALDHPDFLKLKDEWLRGTPGLVGVFTKFLFGENVPIDAVKQLIDWVHNNKPILNQLPKNVTDYNTYEELLDDTMYLDGVMMAKKFTNKMPSAQKNMMRELNNDNTKIYVYLVKEFQKLGEKIIAEFFGKIAKYKSAQEILDSMREKVEGLKGSSEERYKQTVQEINSTPGTQIVYNNNGIIITFIMLYSASKKLGCGTEWCISGEKYSWDSYVSGTNKQYFVWNFNKDISDPMAFVAATIAPDGDTTAAHDRSDTDIESGFWVEMEAIGAPRNIFTAMSEKDRESVILAKLETGESISDEEYEFVPEEKKDTYILNQIELLKKHFEYRAQKGGSEYDDESEDENKVEMPTIDTIKVLGRNIDINKYFLDTIFKLHDELYMKSYAGGIENVEKTSFKKWVDSNISQEDRNRTGKGVLFDTFNYYYTLKNSIGGNSVVALLDDIIQNDYSQEELDSFKNKNKEISGLGYGLLILFSKNYPDSTPKQKAELLRKYWAPLEANVIGNKEEELSNYLIDKAIENKQSLNFDKYISKLKIPQEKIDLYIQSVYPYIDKIRKGSSDIRMINKILDLFQNEKLYFRALQLIPNTVNSIIGDLSFNHLTNEMTPKSVILDVIDKNPAIFEEGIKKKAVTGTELRGKDMLEAIKEKRPDILHDYWSVFMFNYDGENASYWLKTSGNKLIVQYGTPEQIKRYIGKYGLEGSDISYLIPYADDAQILRKALEKVRNDYAIPFLFNRSMSDRPEQYKKIASDEVINAFMKKKMDYDIEEGYYLDRRFKQILEYQTPELIPTYLDKLERTKLKLTKKDEVPFVNDDTQKFIIQYRPELFEKYILFKINNAKKYSNDFDEISFFYFAEKKPELLKQYLSSGHSVYFQKKPKEIVDKITNEYPEFIPYIIESFINAKNHSFSFEYFITQFSHEQLKRFIDADIERIKTSESEFHGRKPNIPSFKIDSYPPELQKYYYEQLIRIPDISISFDDKQRANKAIGAKQVAENIFRKIIREHLGQ